MSSTPRQDLLQDLAELAQGLPALGEALASVRAVSDAPTAQPPEGSAAAAQAPRAAPGPQHASQDTSILGELATLAQGLPEGAGQAQPAGPAVENAHQLVGISESASSQAAQTVDLVGEFRALAQDLSLPAEGAGLPQAAASPAAVTDADQAAPAVDLVDEFRALAQGLPAEGASQPQAAAAAAAPSTAPAPVEDASQAEPTEDLVDVFRTLAQGLPEGASQPPAQGAGSGPSAATQASSQADPFAGVQIASEDPAIYNAPKTSASASSTTSTPDNSGMSAAELFMETGLLGLPALIGGLVDLLGGGSAAAPPPLVKYAMPTALDIQTGTDGPGSGLSNVDYDQSGNPRTYSGAAQQQGASQASGDAGQAGNGSSQANQGGGSSGTQNITVNVQTMDSQSFVDHADDIANAVKSAMLNNHSIGDVVADY